MRALGRGLLVLALASTLGTAGVATASGAPPPSAAPSRAPSSQTIVRTSAGLVRGTSSPASRSFQGIPYAAPPVGPLRWRSPRPPARWAGVRDATHPGNRCAQAANPVSGTAGSTSEDCLYLNVTVPNEPAGRRLPVLVYLHGGGLSSGAGSDQEPRRLAVQAHAIVVTLNYRLGVFGFFGHTGLRGSGTFALQDQQSALSWVRRNIARFGGNDRNTTLFGESGGGDSVCAQLVSPSARGLFDKALIQSGTCTDANPVDDLYPGAGPAVATWKSLSTVDQAGDRAAAKLGCATTTLACLRAIPAAKLLADPAVTATYWSPAYGTGVLPEPPATAIARGRAAHVPMMMGTTSDEASLLVATSYQTIDADTYRQLLGRAFGADADQVSAAYPLESYGSPTRAWSAIVGDRGYVCPNQETETILSRTTPTYGYEFTDQHPPLIFDVDPTFPLGAYHGSDVPYLWDTPHHPVRLTAPQRMLADQMIGYLGGFATTGNPNGTGRPHWPRIRTAPPALHQFTPRREGQHPTPTATRHHCRLWHSLR